MMYCQNIFESTNDDSPRLNVRALPAEILVVDISGVCSCQDRASAQASDSQLRLFPVQCAELCGWVHGTCSRLSWGAVPRAA